ncbi:hypothetical protein [Ruminococcus callidus]|uniref:hypothetical protein n=1 Tax=Ruminococcus callidus TaxID=40519 RepID=UPI0023F0D7F4|nr:hypothetical protein [Ruminococcus callidus]
MANLQRTHHQLEKAEKKLRKYSRSQKQFQVQFVRKPNTDGKFKTTVHIRRGEKSSRYAGHGLIHKAVRFQTRFTGDKPSVTKSLDSLKPKTFRGKVLKRSAQLVNRTAHTAWHTAESTALGAETVTFKTTKAAERNVRYKLQQKYRQEAVDDYHRGTIATLVIAKDAVHGTRRHFKQKKQFKLEKARYRLQKAEYKLFKGEQYRPKLAKNRKELKAERRKFRERKKSFKRFRKIQSADPFTAKVAVRRFQRRKKQYKTDAKKIRTTSRKLKKEKKFQKKTLRKQWRIADLSRPAPLLLKPANYTGKRLAASGWQKAVRADENNDFLSAVEAVKRHGVDKALEKMQPYRLKERNQKKKEKLEKKRSDTRQRLQKREDKLKNKSEQLKRRKKPKKLTKDSFGDRLKNALRQAFQFIKNIYNKEARAVLLACLVPILIIALVLAFILMIFSGILSGSGFVLGTYAAQDYDLSEAEKYYTKLAYDMNEKILKVSSDTDWKNGLAAFGANKRNLKDDPDNWYWGRSSVYDWDPVYDFDVYKLWSFLCAYYYDFDADNNGDILYWSYDRDTENLLNEIFNAEYEFVYWYDNRSRWEERSVYNYWGGGSAETGRYYRAEKDAFVYSGRPYKYRFKPIAYTSELSKYFDSEGYVCINADYRVLNPNDDYALTGFMIMDHRWYSGTKEPFYYVDNDTQTFFFMKGDTRYDRSFWGWNNDDAWFLISPTDTHIWNDTISDTCMYGYYEKYDWKTECNLYYNVKQKKSFERVLEDKLKSQSHRDERLEYYKLLAGQESGSETLYGNHQTLRNMLPGDTIRNYSVKQAFGYDMWEWNQTNDGLYQGIKYYCNTGTRLYAPFDCKIKKVDTANRKITLRKDDVQYWYDGSGGTNRDTEVTITNAVLLSGYAEGDTIREGENFATTTYTNVNFHIEIDTDGYGWDYIDPRLVLY